MRLQDSGRPLELEEVPPSRLELEHLDQVLARELARIARLQATVKVLRARLQATVKVLRARLR